MPRNRVRLMTVFATTVTLLAAPQALTNGSDRTQADAGVRAVEAASRRTSAGPGVDGSGPAPALSGGSTAAATGSLPAGRAAARPSAPAAPARTTDTVTRQSGDHLRSAATPEGAASGSAAASTAGSSAASAATSTTAPAAGSAASSAATSTTASAAGSAASSAAASAPAAAPAAAVAGIDTAVVGFNWPNAVAVYVNHWDQQTVTHADRSRPFRVAAAHGATIMRTFLGTVDSFRATRSPDPVVREAAWRDLRALLDDAAAQGVRLILSNYLTEEAVEALAGRQYRSWPEARRALVTAGSPPWLAFRQWMDEATTRFAGHPAALSWEVMNEPGWMLGIDDGTVGHDAAAVFLDTFQGRYQRAGVTVNAGGRPKYDTTLLSDAQVRLMTRHVDVLDDHLYPEGGSAEAMLDAVGAYRDRVLRLTGRALPVVLGEIGTQPESFFTAVMAGAEERGFGRVVWGFDAYDDNAFSDVAREHVLQTIAAGNRR